MKPGEAFEIKCYEYLKNTYSSNSIKFHREGGMDSTKSDISVYKNGNLQFYIEAKDASAQSGQFVLLPDESTQTFIFSPKNKSSENEMTDFMIQFMNSDFERFNNAGTSGEKLNIGNKIFSDWIINHYKSKNVKYVISKGRNFVILPLEKFNEYFNIKASFRIKKSGSGEPAKRDIPAVKKLFSENYPSAKYQEKGKKLFISTTEPISIDRFIMGKYTYYLSRQDDGIFEIRRLSNTYNMNVIFSISLQSEQDSHDLKIFEADIK